MSQPNTQPTIKPGGKFGMMDRLSRPGTAVPATVHIPVAPHQVPPVMHEMVISAPATTPQTSGATRLYNLRHTFRLSNADNKRFKAIEHRLVDKLSELGLPLDRSMVLRALLAMTARRLEDDAFIIELVVECTKTPPATPGTGVARKPFPRKCQE
jgi:hypothetical protein